MPFSRTPMIVRRFVLGVPGSALATAKKIEKRFFSYPLIPLNDNASELLNDCKPPAKSRNAKPQCNASQA